MARVAEMDVKRVNAALHSERWPMTSPTSPVAEPSLAAHDSPGPWAGLWAFAMVTLPTAGGVTLAVAQGQFLPALVAIPLAAALAWKYVRSGGGVPGAVFFAALLPFVSLIFGWEVVERQLIEEVHVDVADLTHQDKGELAYKKGLFVVDDGTVRADLMGSVRKKGVSDRPDGFYYAVPLVPDAWSEKDPVPAWAVCHPRLDVSREGGAASCRKIFDGERHRGEWQEPEHFQGAVRDAEKKHGLRSNPDAVLLDWAWERGPLWSPLVAAIILFLFAGVLFPLSVYGRRASARRDP